MIVILKTEGIARAAVSIGAIMKSEKLENRNTRQATPGSTGSSRSYQYAARVF